MQITLSSSKIIKFLSYFTLLLILIHSMILAIYFTIGDADTFNFIRMFDLDMERNIPTLFSSLLFTLSSFLFYLLSKSEEQSSYWVGLSMVFLFLAFDESAKIHEKLGDFTEHYIDASGFLYYPWFISYGVFVLILAFVYARFFLNMERKVYFSFFLSATIFLIGAVGFDILGANEASSHGEDTLTYCILYTIEESLEMFGLIYLISILLNLLNSNNIMIKIQDND